MTSPRVRLSARSEQGLGLGLGLSRGLMVCVLLAGPALSCLYNDLGTFVESNDRNPSAVRFVEGIPLEPEAHEACGGDACPVPRFTALPYFLNPEDPAYYFCICSEDREDSGQLQGVFLYAEDQDENLDGSVKDSLYAAALLDWDPTLGDSAFDYVAYRAYLDPQRPLELASASPYDQAPKRPRPYVRSIEFSIGSTFDLCNGAGRSVGPGFHTLSIMVTDRPWAERGGIEEDTASSGTGELPDSAVSLEGVPDIAAGATYDIQTYVFSCYVEGEDQCGCEDIPDS